MNRDLIGKEIRIIAMPGDPAEADYVGRVGIVKSVDSAGQLHGTWGGLAIIPEHDTFEVLREPTIEYADDIMEAVADPLSLDFEDYSAKVELTEGAADKLKALFTKKGKQENDSQAKIDALFDEHEEYMKKLSKMTTEEQMKELENYYKAQDLDALCDEIEERSKALEDEVKASTPKTKLSAADWDDNKKKIDLNKFEF